MLNNLMCNHLLTPAGGELYTGLTSDVLGRDSVILRSLGGRSTMRTETDEKLLHGEASTTIIKNYMQTHRIQILGDEAV